MKYTALSRIKPLYSAGVQKSTNERLNAVSETAATRTNLPEQSETKHDKCAHWSIRNWKRPTVGQRGSLTNRKDSGLFIIFENWPGTAFYFSFSPVLSP